MTGDPFGFGNAKKGNIADKLKQVTPQPDNKPDVPLDKVDKIAEGAGFTSREPQSQAQREARKPAPAAIAPTIDRRRKDAGPWVAINTRAPVRVAEPFQRFCDENRYSYWEGIEELMKRAAILKS